MVASPAWAAIMAGSTATGAAARKRRLAAIGRRRMMRRMMRGAPPGMLRGGATSPRSTCSAPSRALLSSAAPMSPDPRLPALSLPRPNPPRHSAASRAARQPPQAADASLPLLPPPTPASTPVPTPAPPPFRVRRAAGAARRRSALRRLLPRSPRLPGRRASPASTRIWWARVSFVEACCPRAASPTRLAGGGHHDRLAMRAVAP